MREVTLLSSPALTGDVDGNGLVNIDDLTLLIECLLNDGEAIGNTDIDADGQMNIEDVSALIEILISE
jgi:hypothetical protein